ncbi:DUF1329 domain-containing protein [Pseudomonas azotoformans]|uniref:DUF1329 domain-containing protein n=1 Tax=Pseudomonas azotoformans TaxID=47878 RepID=A0A140GWM1_PSEAZ|nr:DUF1329 domain-containing protein [Pseudomonas azotoformans]AMN82715.1 hypothetical protein AYR47_20550 [Pseudomonas azotoformans]
MKLNPIYTLLLGSLLLPLSSQIWAVSDSEAQQLKSSLTPLGGERAGNSDGSIPAWSQGFTQVPAGVKPGPRIPDYFASDKVLYSVTSQNLSQYADKLSDGQKALFAKYPNYRIDVYPTRRTAAAPQWVYDNTLKNATSAHLTNQNNTLEGASGGIPFPIPKSGAEVVWNHQLSWRGEAWKNDFNVYIITANGQRILSSTIQSQREMPYYFQSVKSEYKGVYWMTKLVNLGPPLRAGEALLGREPLDYANGGPQSWVYLTGQRRVRKLPVSSYDTPTPTSSGVANFDEVSVFTGPLDRYDWTIVGRQEMLIPYNSNKILQPSKDDEILSDRFLNPDHMRWELHRVWVVEGNLVAGKRHSMPKRRLYVDEDTWMAMLGDSWDANQKLWRTYLQLPYATPELPGLVRGMFAQYDLQTGAWMANNVVTEKRVQNEIVKPFPDSDFSPDGLAADGVR